MAKDGLFQTTKFKGLCRRLRIPRAHALGHLELMWFSAYERLSPDFRSAAQVEDAAEWEGESGVFAETLADPDIRFLDHDDEGYVIHDFWEHAPEYIKKRAHRAKIDWRANTDPEAPTATERLPSSCHPAATQLPDGCQADAYPTEPNPTEPISSPKAPQAGGPKKKASKRFKPPTAEEVSAYVAEKGHHFHPEQFVDFYQSKGWIVGKTKMKDWKAACRNWERIWKEKHPEAQSKTQHENMKERRKRRGIE